MERHAVLIVNDTFPKSDGCLCALSTVKDDLTGMTRVLNKLRSPPFKITTIVNGEAVAIDDALNAVLATVNPAEDLLLIYYAGHGRILKTKGAGDSLLLSTFSSRAKPDKRFLDFDYSMIEVMLKSRNVRRSVIILDCCYSGVAVNDQEARGLGAPPQVPSPFSSPDYVVMPIREGKVEGPPSSRDMGDGVYILTACTADQQATGNTRTGCGVFTGHLLKALETARDGSAEAITLQGVFQDVFEAMKGLPQTPSMIKRGGESPYLVIAPRGVLGEGRNRSLKNWEPPAQDRLARLKSMTPMYLLDSGFRFVHWNAVFQDVIANQLGLVIGCHAMEFVNRLENLQALTKRNPVEFPTPSEEDIALAEDTGEIWPGFKKVDVERLEFISSRFGLVVFHKLAQQIRESDYRRSTTWQIELNVYFAQRHKEYWKNVLQVVESEDLWTSYAESYDAVVQKYPSYIRLVDKVVEQIKECSECLEIGAGTGNTTLRLLDMPGRRVTAIESNDAMLGHLSDKLMDYEKRTKILKGDATTVVRRICQERLDDQKRPEVYDACVMMNVLFALQDPGECLKAVFRVLKPGGVLSLSTPHMDAPVDLLMENIRKWHLEHNQDEWLAGNAKAWDAAQEINLNLGRLATDRRIDLIRVKQLVIEAQFKIIDISVEEEYEGCVILLKAIKPLLVENEKVKVLDEVKVLDNELEQSDDKKQRRKKSGPNDEAVPPEITPPPPPPEEGRLRRKITLFLSYARRDTNIEEFLTELKALLATSKSYEYLIWKDNVNVLAGEDWNTKIQSAILECHLGLLLVSPKFLGSEYITQQELTKFVEDKRKPIIPVLFHAVDFDRMDLKGLGSFQIFALDRRGVRVPYGKCGQKKLDFLSNLFTELEERINSLLSNGGEL